MPGELDLPPMTKEALAEFDAIDDTGKERPKAKEAGVEPKAKRPRKMSLAEEPRKFGKVLIFAYSKLLAICSLFHPLHFLNLWKEPPRCHVVLQFTLGSVVT